MESQLIEPFHGFASITFLSQNFGTPDFSNQIQFPEEVRTIGVPLQLRTIVISSSSRLVYNRGDGTGFGGLKQVSLSLSTAN